MKDYIKIVLLALCFALVTTSGLIKLNVNHWMHLPTFKEDIVVERDSFNLLHLGFDKTFDIRMKDEIKGVDTVNSIIRVLQEADTNTTVVFHLAGYGGDIETLFRLVNEIHRSNAKVIGIVEAPVYSAHAYLAANIPLLIIDKYSYLMFHGSSILNTNCLTSTGEDRGVSNVYHCQMMKNSHLALTHELIWNTTVLTNEERVTIENGGDVYLFPKDIQKRLKHTTVEL